MPSRPPAESLGMGRPTGRALFLTVCLALAAAIALMLLAGCTTTQPSSTAAIDLPALPASKSAACARPAKLPSTGLNAQDTERYWATDRSNLAKCGDRHAATVGHYENLRKN